MLNVTNWGNEAKLYAPLAKTDHELQVSPHDALRFQVPAGSWYYLTLRQGPRREVVRVVGSVGRILTIERAQDGTARQDFEAGACLSVEWNVQQLREFIDQVGGGAEPTGVQPGTYCLDCTTCIEVNAAGQLVSVNGAGGCP